MVDSWQNATYTYVGAFVDELGRAGLHHVVVCPGSRSTPLAMVFAAHEGVRVWMHIDERSAAFFALGMAKRLSEPVALLCTSGTAAANFLPALVEAHLTHVPLLVLTADRPQELRENGAPQSIDQNRLYGSHVKWFSEVALPEATNEALRSIRTLAGRALALTQALPAGPVHLNFPLREPLTPDPIAAQPLPAIAQRDPVAWHGRPNHAPYVEVQESPLALPSPTTVQRLAALLATHRRGLMIVGPLTNAALIPSLIRLAQQTGYPILADPLSGLRSGPHDRSQVLASYDAFLRNEPFTTTHAPEVVLRFGAMPTSKPLLLYLKRYPECPQIVVDGEQGWTEPTQLASEIIHADPLALCRELLARLLPAESPWLASWRQAEAVTQRTLATSMLALQPLFEGRIFYELAHALPAKTLLYTGNSMPIRDLDTFFWGCDQPVRLLGNRGANGIDGVISSALGASAAQPEDAAVLVIGDLSFLHDLNGLLAAHLHRLKLVIVLINNDGGGIFSFLPQAAYPEHFEQLFGTPTGLDLRPAIEMYGGHFQSIASWEHFRQALDSALQVDGLHVLHLRTDRASNVQMHRALWQALDEALLACL